MSEPIRIRFPAHVARKSTLKDKGISVTLHLPQGQHEASALLELCYEEDIPLMLDAVEIARSVAKASSDSDAPRVVSWRERK